MKYKTINDFTKESMKEVIRKEFKGRAVDHDGNCLYLTDDRRKCAVGCFIPDGHIAQKEKDAAYEVSRKYLDLKFPLEKKDLQKFQSYHDADIKFQSASFEKQKELLCEWIDDNVID